MSFEKDPFTLVGFLALFFGWVTITGYLYARQWGRQAVDDELPAMRRKVFRMTTGFFLACMIGATVIAAGGDHPRQGLLFFGLLLPLLFLAFSAGEQAYFALRMRRIGRRSSPPDRDADA
ncbi:hypothetical protein [Lacipirellula limnantheis]|uniref:Uncharacterized protein n=1 Tax=Lacipirellula limnantheis TaxID=2528024 RepID=A0A517U1L1_9BACT|nr:hypothetical protein [Lacipirellula limnantheis]QDT74515.1 hypothetical protein I41_37120 [Lacipirellula limnantheis]